MTDKEKTPDGVEAIETEEEEFLDEDVYRKVPEKETIPWYHFLMIFVGMWASLAAIGAGVGLGTGITPWRGALGLFIGYMIAMVIGLFCGRLGVTRRLGIYPLLERPMGVKWGFIPIAFSGVIAATFIGVQADAVTRVVMGTLGWEITTLFGPVTNRAILALVLTSLMMFSAYKGIKYIKYVSWVSIPLYLSALAIGSYLAIQAFEGGFSDLMTIEQTAISFEQAVFLGLSLYAGFSVTYANVTRFIKSVKGFYIAVIIGYVAATFIPISGVIMGASGQVDYWLIYPAFGLPVAVYATISFFMAQWTTNDNNAFAAGLSMATVSGILNRSFGISRIGRKACTLGPIFYGIILAVLGAGAIDPLMATIGALGSWLPPIGGVLIAHYYVVERFADADKKGLYSSGFAGIISWIAASVPAQLGILPWAAVTGVLTAFLLYLVLYYGVEKPIFGRAEEKEEYEEEVLGIEE